MKLLSSLSIALIIFSANISAQTSAFTYQGKLTDAGASANGAFDFTFKLFSVSTGGTQVGTDVLRDDVTVTGGIFTITLDFGSSPFTAALSTGNYLEIWVRPGASTGAYTALTPRQPITASPYSISTIRAQSAALADNATQLGGVNANQYVQTNDARLADNRNPLPNSPNYIQNTTAQQSSSNFNISGNGTSGGTLSANTVNATTQYNIGGNRVLSNGGQGNLFAGRDAGTSSTTGFTNSFFGAQSGQSNTTGGANSFFGFGAGQSNTASFDNSFFGTTSGQSNTTGQDNSFFGAYSGGVNTEGTFNSFFGSLAGGNNTIGSLNAFFGQGAGAANTEGNNNSFFGRSSGPVNTTGSSNSFFGIGAGSNNNTGNRNSFVGEVAGFSNTTGSDNAFFGYHSGQTNGVGSGNTFIGMNADPAAGGLVNATAIGANAEVAQSNSLVLGSINGTNGATAGTNVGIGITAPTFKLHVVDQANTGLRVQTNVAGGTVASFGGNGAFQVDAPGIEGGRFNVKENGNIGIGTGNPNAKLQVAGGIVYIAAPNSLVITSPNGTCWFITVSDAGILSSFSITCP